MSLWPRKPVLADQVTTLIVDYLEQRGLPPPKGGVELRSELASFGLDSLDGVAIVTELESRFDLAIDPSEARKTRTLSDLVALVARAQGGAERR